MAVEKMEKFKKEKTFFAMLIMPTIYSSAWAQIRATLLNFEQPCSNWGFSDI